MRAFEKNTLPDSQAKVPAATQCLSSGKAPDLLNILWAERRALTAYARSFGVDADSAEDLVQDAIIAAWQAQHQFQAGTSIRGWLFAILRNKFFSSCRRTRKDAKLQPWLAAQIDYVECKGAVVVDGQEMAQRICNLKPGEQAVVLALASGEKYIDAAAELGIPEGTVKSRMFRARERLQA